MNVARSIVFDFDGTLAVGNGPVLAYARAVAPSANPGFVDRVKDGLNAFDAGRSGYRDGYHVVAKLAARDGVSSGTMNQAYQASREMLGTSDAPVEAPAGLAELLNSLNRHAELHVATNAPRAGVEQVLKSWEVRGYFAQVHVNVGKPAGLYPIIENSLRGGPVLAVGDIVEFDLQPAIDLGADTALVGASAATSKAPVTMRGASLTTLHDELIHWAAQPPAPTSSPHTSHLKGFPDA